MDSTRLNITSYLFFTDHPSQITDVNILPGINNHNNIVMITATIKSKFIDRSPRKTLAIAILVISQSQLKCIQRKSFALAIEFPQFLTENSDV